MTYKPLQKTVLFLYCVEEIFVTVKMENFSLNKEFDSFDEVLKAKKHYEHENNVVLVISSSHLLKGDSEIIKQCVYDRLSLQCKAGKERRTESKGMRLSATFKKNCLMKVHFLFRH